MVIKSLANIISFESSKSPSWFQSTTTFIFLLAVLEKVNIRALDPPNSKGIGVEVKSCEVDTVFE